jgi:hypothetical protein
MLEERVQRIQEAIQGTNEGKEAALILIKQKVPCIMHTENRAGEKIITVAISIGATRFLLDQRISGLDRFVEQIQNIVQRRILGSEVRPKQWRFPLKENGKEVAKVSLSINKTRRFVTGMDHLIAVIFHKEENCVKRDFWQNMIEEDRLAMTILRKRSDYSDKDIDEFQSLIDSYYKKYLSETGVEGITNYIHILASGHMKYYMQLHRNLYKFSQQDWESLNSKFKQVFF